MASQASLGSSTVKELGRMGGVTAAAASRRRWCHGGFSAGAGAGATREEERAAGRATPGTCSSGAGRVWSASWTRCGLVNSGAQIMSDYLFMSFYIIFFLGTFPKIAFHPYGFSRLLEGGKG